MKGLLLGILALVIIVIVAPSVLPASETVVNDVLDLTSDNVKAGTAEYVIIDTLPWWGLGAAVVGGLWMIIKRG